MGKLIDLYDWLSQEGVMVFDRQLPFSSEDTKALTIQLSGTGTWGIFLDTGRLTHREMLVAAYHESGHYATGTTHAVCSPQDLVEKHEVKADKWAIKKLIRKDELEAAVKAGHTEIWDLADYFGVTEDFIRKTVCWYQNGNLDTEYYYPKSSQA